MPLGAFKAALMGTAGVSAAGDVVLLHDTDYSDAASASITSGIDSTYGEYIFRFYNINPTTDKAEFGFQMDVSGSTDYDTTITSTSFFTYHKEDGTQTSLAYDTGQDQAEGTGFQTIGTDVGSGADESCAGELHLFNPASTTYVKHFYSRFQEYVGSGSEEVYTAGYLNLTAALDKIQFKFASGNFDGTIKMWGVK